MVTEKKPRKRAIDRNKPKNLFFIAAIKALVRELNDEKKGEKRRLGITGRVKGETCATLAQRAGRYSIIFNNIRAGREPPTYDLIKRIAVGLPWSYLKVFDWVQVLIEAMGKDLKKIVVGYDPENVAVAERMKLIIRDAAIELMEQNKEEGT